MTDSKKPQSGTKGGAAKRRAPDLSGIWTRVRSVIGLPTDVAALTGLEQVNDQLAAIVQSSEDAILSVSNDGLVVTWNTGAEKMYGYKASQMVGRSVERIFPAERRHELEQMLQAVKTGRSVNRFVTQRLTKSGGLIDVSVTVSPIRNRQGKIVGASSISRDITEQQDLLRRQREFVSITSHELRTPLTALTGYLSLAEAEGDCDRKDEFVSRAFLAARRLTTLTEDLLQAARLEEDRVAFQLRPLTPSKIVADIVEDVRPSLAARGLKLTYLETVPKARIKADRVRLTQIIRNLLDNAIKYTPSGGRIEVTVKGNSRSVAVCICDNGVGIDPDNLDRIFDKFFREYHSQSVAAGGAGLGLFITKELVERQGGELTITGRRNRGTTAIIRFPRYVASKGKAKAKSKRRVTKKSAAKR